MTHVVVYDEIPSTDPRLGRHVEHDSRSRAFAYEEDTSAYANARHQSATPTLDQGNTGSCTGNASTKNLTYEDFWAAFEEQFPGVLSVTDTTKNEKVAQSVYSDAEDLDGDGPFPPNDNGSTGLSVAKVLQKRGWISGYQHAFSLSAALTALSKQAVIVGTNWYTGMFNPTTAGEIVVSGKVEGGHEYVLDEIDVDKQRVWMQQSWGASWGLGSRAWMSWTMLEQLLGEQGDVTIFTPLSQPAPTPTPVPPAPTPAPSPDGPQATFMAQAENWVALRHSSKANVAFEKNVQDYLDWLRTQQST